MNEVCTNLGHILEPDQKMKVKHAPVLELKAVKMSGHFSLWALSCCETDGSSTG